LKSLRAITQCLLVAFLAVPLLGAAAYRDFHPLELDTRALQVVVGYVSDGFNDRGILGARVLLNGVDGHSLETTTDGTGFFRFAALDPAYYPFAESTLNVTHAGYKDAVPIAPLPSACLFIKLQSRTVILMHGIGGSYEGTWGGNSGAFASELTSQKFKVVGVDVGGFPWNILPVSVAEEKMEGGPFLVGD
jgi:hypothetical protein